MNNRPSFGRPLTVRGHDLFDTPPIALDPLFVHEPLLAGVDTICEPFCGKGNLVLAMRARGITVHASDLLDRGCPDSTVLDFLAMTERPPNCDVLVSNCPYAGAMGFIEHALGVLRFRVVVLLLSPSFLFTADRVERLHKPGHLRRVHFLAERLQGMHDAAHLAAGGKTASQPLVHAWFVFERDYCGPATINSVSLKRPTERMPWAQLPMSAPSHNGVREVMSNELAHSPFGGSVAATRPTDAGQPRIADYYLEQRVKFPTIDGAFGTADLIARVGNVIHLVDFKFGSGVRVLALYPDGDEDVINAQLLFYAAAARHSLPEFFAGADEIVLTILQPQSIDPDAEMVSTVTVTHAELDAICFGENNKKVGERLLHISQPSASVPMTHFKVMVHSSVHG